jgi:AraC-like DNA-binding protein
MARIDTRNSSRYWRDPRVAGLSCLLADFTAHDYAPHSHEALVVAVTEVGGSEFRSRGRTDEAKSSVLLVFNPDEPHSGRMAWSKRWRYRGLYLASSAVEMVKQALGLQATPYFTRNVFTDRDLIDGFLTLHHALDDGRDALHERELLIGSFGTLIGRHAAGDAQFPLASHERSKVEALRALMLERYPDDLTLEDLGAAVGLTTFQLIGVFRKATGMTPHAYLTQVRLKAAMSELKGGTPISEAALAAGFYDQSALTKHFKRSYGITPLQWVRATQA